jgi:hypothetical protein
MKNNFEAQQGFRGNGAYLQKFVIRRLCFELLGCFRSGFEGGGGHGEVGSRMTMWLAMAADLVVIEVDCFVSVEVVGKGYNQRD